MMKNVYWSSCTVPVILVRFSSRNFNFLEILSRQAQISNFMKIRPVGAELFHADRRTDMTNLFLISNFRRVLNVVLFLLGNSPASEF
jgi:hypothetical protein